VSCSIVSSTFRSCNISSSSLRYGLCSLGVATADFSLTAVACSYIISSYIRHREISISKHQSFFNICEIFTGHCSLSICETSIQKVDFGRVETLVLFSPSLDQSSPNYTCTCRSALCMQHHLLTDIFAIKSWSARNCSDANTIKGWFNTGPFITFSGTFWLVYLLVFSLVLCSLRFSLKHTLNYYLCWEMHPLNTRHSYPSI